MDTQLVLLLGGILVILAGGFLALALTSSRRVAGTVAALSLVAGASMGLVPVALVLGWGRVLSFAGPWPMPNGALMLELDPLSAFFLAPVFALSAVAGIYGRVGAIQGYDAGGRMATKRGGIGRGEGEGCKSGR